MAAVSYLLVVLALTAAGSSGGGGHANPAVLLLGLAFILTFPWSWVAVGIMDNLTPSPPTSSSAEQISIFVILAGSAVVNAAVIYLVTGFLSRAVRALFKKPLT